MVTRLWVVACARAVVDAEFAAELVEDFLAVVLVVSRWLLRKEVLRRISFFTSCSVMFTQPGAGR